MVLWTAFEGALSAAWLGFLEIEGLATAGFGGVDGVEVVFGVSTGSPVTESYDGFW